MLRFPFMAQERIESRRAEDKLRTEMLQSEHRLRSLLVDSEREKQKWSEPNPSSESCGLFAHANI